ncbi:MAG: hypothetical protein ACOX87_14935, partial [Chloroflexota bacterium]
NGTLPSRPPTIHRWRLPFSFYPTLSVNYSRTVQKLGTPNEKRGIGVTKACDIMRPEPQQY